MSNYRCEVAPITRVLYLYGMGNKKFEDGKVSGAPNQRTIFVENVCRTTDDKNMEDFVSNIVNVVDFQHASVDEAASKSFKFKELACATSKVLGLRKSKILAEWSTEGF